RTDATARPRRIRWTGSSRRQRPCAAQGDGRGPAALDDPLGPPGTGKTTLAAIGAKRTKSRFVAVSAVASGVGELRKIIDESRKLRALTNQGTVLFIDEIHRFNKAQQDVVLPYVENGDVTLL